MSDVCNRDCLNCTFEDCVVDDITQEEREEINSRSKPKRVLSEASKQHAREYCKKYYQEHRAEFLAYRKSYYEAHKEECRRSTRERYQRKKRERENA